MNNNQDHQNKTFQPKVDQLFERDGTLKPFQRCKYEPKLARLRREGITHADPILDVGVGYGAWLSLLQREGFHALYGMDPFEGSIGIAQTRTTARFSLGRIEQISWPFDAASFSVITCFDVVEHLEDPPIFFRHAARYLKPGGLLVITTPLLEIGYRMRKIPWLGRPDTNPTHINVKPPAYWLEAAKQGPFELIEAWRGDNLTHIRFIDSVGKLASAFGIDHQQIPGLRQFEQAFCMLLRARK